VSNFSERPEHIRNTGNFQGEKLVILERAYRLLMAAQGIQGVTWRLLVQLWRQRCIQVPLVLMEPDGNGRGCHLGCVCVKTGSRSRYGGRGISEGTKEETG